MRIVLVAAALVACSGMEPGVPSGSASVETQVSPACMGMSQVDCTANAACFWQTNGPNCMMGMDMMQMCAPDQCVDADPASVPPRSVCGCATSAGAMTPYFCVRDAMAMVDCTPVPAGCGPMPMTPTDAEAEAACSCLMGASGPCHAAKDVRALCDCG
ncbi:MAG TPA: hypothetical protein VGH20_21650 [Myxococcales bacterium]|jgi:hypothetical protein